MRFCSSKARASSALISSRVLTILGWLTMAGKAASVPGDGVCANASLAKIASTIAAIEVVNLIVVSQTLDRTQTYLPQPPGEPVGQIAIDHAAEIDVGRRHLLLAEDEEHAEPVGEPQMRIGQAAQLVMIVFHRLVVDGLAHLDREQVFRNRAVVHDDVGKYRLAQFIVGGNDRSVWQFQQTLAEPVVLAVDLPAVELPFQMHGH